MIKLFKTCPNRDMWHRRPPKSEDIWHEEYFAKRNWSGHVMWINSLAAMNFEPGEDNSVVSLQETITEWKKHYKTQWIEEAIRMWCVETCTGRWDKFFIYGVEFENEADAILFKFAWCV